MSGIGDFSSLILLSFLAWCDPVSLVYVSGYFLFFSGKNIDHNYSIKNQTVEKLLCETFLHVHNTCVAVDDIPLLILDFLLAGVFLVQSSAIDLRF